MNENVKAFIVYVNSLGLRMTIHPARKAWLALLLAEEVTFPVKYSDFADVFLKKLANVRPEQSKVNKHAIELEKTK